MVLLEREKISAPKLAEMFEVTPRTIYRDIETISLAGIPVTASTGVNGGISIMAQYKIDKKLFTATDITTLLMGLGSLTPTLADKTLTNTLAKVKSLIPEEQFKSIELKSNQIAIDLTMWSSNKSLQPNLESIKQALNNNQYLQFIYTDGNGQKNQRKVEPHQLVLKQGHWYLQGYCDLRQDFRIFKLLRISQLQTLDAIFVPRPFDSKPLNCSNWIEQRLIQIKLLIDESLRERIAEGCNEEDIIPAGNNKLIVSLPFVDDEQGYNLLLSFGNKCECLEPENVRNELIRRIKMLLDVYQA